MTSPDLFDADAKENAVTLISRFVNWVDQHPQTETIRIDWFLTECRDFLEDPHGAIWSNIEMEKPRKRRGAPAERSGAEQDPNLDGSRALAEASPLGEG